MSRVKPHWPEATPPTPEQWAEWFVANPPEERVKIAESVLDSCEIAVRCLVQDHEILLDEAEKYLERLFNERA